MGYLVKASVCGFATNTCCVEAAYAHHNTTYTVCSRLLDKTAGSDDQQTTVLLKHASASPDPSNPPVIQHLSLVVAQDLVAPVGDGVINVIQQGTAHRLWAIPDALEA